MSVNIFHEGFPKPETLDEAVALLITHVFSIPEWKAFIEQTKDVDDASFLVETHQTLGRQLRNAWGLWEQKAHNKLYYYMYAFGLRHPDDISAVILQSAYCKYYGGEFDVEAAGRYYKGWWEMEWEKCWVQINEAADYVIERHEEDIKQNGI